MTVTSRHVVSPAAHDSGLSLTRLNILRAGYLFVGLGLAIVKWPHLADASSISRYEGVTLCMLTAMSLLTFLGLRYPIRLLPVLLFESAWKLLWLGLVALPKALDGDLDAATSQLLTKNLLVVVVLAVIPWRYVWTQYLRAEGDPWRSRHG